MIRLTRSCSPFCSALFPFLALLPLISGNWSCAHPLQATGENTLVKDWVGTKATAFTLPGTDGKPVNIAKDLGKRPVILVFYRGIW